VCLRVVSGHLQGHLRVIYSLFTGYLPVILHAIYMLFTGYYIPIFLIGMRTRFVISEILMYC
jgi:hypothetical protein